MSGSFNSLISSIFLVRGMYRRLIAFALILALMPVASAHAHTRVEASGFPDGRIPPVICHRGNCPQHLPHEQFRRGARSSKLRAQNPGADDEASVDAWTIISLFVGSFTRPVASLAFALCMMSDLAPAADVRPDIRPSAAISYPAPEPDAVFKPGAPADFVSSTPVRLTSDEARMSSWGNGHIVIADPADFPRIRAFDCHSSGSLWDNMRPNLFGQEVSDEWDFYNLINTDRSDFTDATYTAGKGVTIIESGYTFSRTNDPDLHSSRRTLPEVLTRVGITDEFELRMKWIGYSMNDVTDQATGLKDSYFGGSDLYLGVKYEVLQQEDWHPMVTVLGGSTVPTGTGGVSAGTMQPFANLVLGWGFRRWLYLKASTGVDFLRTTDVSQVINGGNNVGPIGIAGNDSNSTWHQSVSLLYQATKRVGGFIEWYSLFSDNSSDNRAQNYADTGLFIYLTTHVQLDVRVGERISNRVDGLFTGTGLSIRF